MMKFTREQLIFVLEQAAGGTLNVIEGVLPQTTSWDDWEANENSFLHMIHGATSSFAHYVSILWAQTEGQVVGDGIGTCDWAGFDQAEEFWSAFLNSHLDRNVRTLTWPDVKPLIEKIVDQNWTRE
jgi:hypothetical protein